jgi:hypothetical protein
MLGQGAHPGAEIGFFEHIAQGQGDDQGEEQTGQAHKRQRQEEIAAFVQPGGRGQATGDAAAVKTENRQPQTADHQHDPEGKDQPHEQWVAAVPADYPLNRGLQQIADAEKDKENKRQEHKRVQPDPLVQVVPHECAQHDPLADGKIDDVHDPEDQGETDGDGDVDAPDEDAVQDDLWQEQHK